MDWWGEFGGGILTKRFFSTSGQINTASNHQLGIGLAGGFLLVGWAGVKWAIMFRMECTDRFQHEF